MARPRFKRLRIDQLNLPQPALRSERRKLDELAASIEAVGVLVPLVVRAIGKDEYAVIAGAEAARVLVREYGYTQKRVGAALGVSEGLVSQHLAVFDLDRSVVTALRKGEIEMRTARALLPLKDDKATQRKLLSRIRKQGLSAGQVSALVAAKRYGKRGMAPMRYTVAGAGKVDARTTRSGKLRVVLQADDKRGLVKLLNSLNKKV